MGKGIAKRKIIGYAGAWSQPRTGFSYVLFPLALLCGRARGGQENRHPISPEAPQEGILSLTSIILADIMA